MKKNNRVDKSIVITVIIAIVILESIALLKGIDGTLFMIIIGLLGCIGGVAIPKEKLIKSS